MALSRRVANQLIPFLPTAELIQAIGNVEQRDRFTPLRQAAWAEIDRCCGDFVVMEAFGPTLMEPVFRHVLQRLHREHPEDPIARRLQAYIEQHTWSALWTIARARLAQTVRRWRR